MSRVDLSLSVAVERTARVQQVEGMFQLPAASESAVQISVDVDLDAKPWQVGLITGPSGCGKTSVARHLFGDALIEGYEWLPDRAIVDCFDDQDVAEITGALSSVGFSSPPAWLRPFRVLSRGEQFRADLARALADPRQLIAIDEFTSVVDRQVAHVGSAAVAKRVRRTPGKQLVAVTCHDDLVDWLQPEWILEPHTGLVVWRSVQPRPRIELAIVRCSREAWPWFAPHHYMSLELNKSARCFLGLIGGKPAAFCAILPSPHPRYRRTWRTHRTVVLPDYQGVGVGRALARAVGGICASNGYSLRTTPTHPAQIACREGCPSWERVAGRRLQRAKHWRYQHTLPRLAQLTARYRYVGGPLPRELTAQARLLWHAH